jgi:1,4-dihydroxy-6-naphthoate synthase
MTLTGNRKQEGRALKINLSLAYSTCPNDTYIFNALAHGLIDVGPFAFDIFLDDVETLNQQAGKGIHDVSKLSFAAIGYLGGTYRLLRSGAALGRGCGPLIVGKPGRRLNRLADARIAVPGLWTSANLFLGLFLSKTPKIESMPFDRIMPAVVRGDVDCGVIIHEGRFTYKMHGLTKLVDLGEWWETETGLPIPLGGIAVRSDVSPRIATQIEHSIRQSVAYAMEHSGSADDYIRTHAQEMSPQVISQHIELYVNGFTLDLGREGRRAVEKMFDLAWSKGILPTKAFELFAGETA